MDRNSFILGNVPTPSVHDTFSDSAQNQPHPKQIPNAEKKNAEPDMYPEGKRDTYLDRGNITTSFTAAADVVLEFLG